MDDATRAKLFAKTELCPRLGCWLWKGKLAWDGYALAWVDGKLQSLHRVGWQHFVGPIPDRLCILNWKCGNRSCWNYRHWRLGTQADVIANRDKAGSPIRGEANKGGRKGCNRLTEGEARVLKKLCRIAERGRAGTKPYTRLSKIFGINPTTVRDIDRGKIWRHI